MIEYLNQIAQIWWDWMSAMFWQVGLLIILIATIDLLLRKWAWPQLRYALWSLVLIKLVLSPTLSLPSGLAPKLTPVVTQMLESATQEELIEFTMPIAIPSADETEGRTVYIDNTAGPLVVYRDSMESLAKTTNERREMPNVSSIPSTPLGAGSHRPSPIAIPSGPRLGWRAYLMGIWLSGAVFLGTWLFVKLNRLKKEKSGGSKQLSLPESFYNQLDRCAQQLKLRRKPRVVTTASIRSPAVFGMVHPVLLMPVGYIRGLSRRDTEYMLLHELAHIKRGDLAAHSLCMLLRLVYWYNPLLWIVGRQLRHLRELCCDATVASLLRDKTSEYRQTLLETARRFLATPVEPGLGLVGLFEDSNRLIARIQWLKKPIWRYRKMKNIAVITTVLILLACVLPMAQADNPQAEEPNVSSGQTEEKSTQSEETLEAEQQKKEDQQKQLQAMQLLKEEQQKQLEAMQRLMAKLKQIEVEKQKLQKELQALMQARSDATAASMEAKFAKDNAAKASMKAKEAKDKALKATMKAKQAKEKAAKTKAQTGAKKDNAEVLIELRKAEDEAKKADHEAQKAYTELRKAEDEVKHWAHLKNKMHVRPKESLVIPTSAPNPKPRPMPVMPSMPPLPVKVELETNVDVEVVDTPEVAVPVPPVPPTVVPAPPEPLSVPAPTPPAPPAVVAPTPTLPAPPTTVATNSLENKTEDVLITEEFVDSDLAKEVFPALSEKAGIPIILDETVEGLITCTLKGVSLDTALEIILAGTPYIHKETPDYYIVYSRGKSLRTSHSVSVASGSPEAIVPAPAAPKPRPKPNRDAKIGRTKDGKFFAITEMHLVSKVNPGSPFVIRNNLGNILLKQSKDKTCDVKAVIRAEAETAAEAKKMAEDVGMHIDSSEEKYYLKPVKPDDDQWSNLSVNLTILVPLGVKPDVKTNLGNVELWNLKGKIKAVSNLGSVKAIYTAGDLELFTKMGEIVFTPPRDLSARLRAETKMGSIKSDLPLTITKKDMFKRTAEGTIGSGRDTIRMTTNMGSIRITNKPPKPTENGPEPMSPGDAIRDNADKLKTQQTQ